MSYTAPQYKQGLEAGEQPYVQFPSALHMHHSTRHTIKT